MEEAKENEHESRCATSPIFPSLALPRSPLISIPNPLLTPKSAQTTPKSTHSRSRRLSELPPISEPRGGTTRERGCVRRLTESCNLSRSLSSVEELVEAPCFELNEDLSFWKDRNVQVLIRIRPIGTAESSLHGYKRCLTQESSQSLTWIGNPETRFTFDHVASESISQEKLFRAVGLPMVENCMSGYNGCMFAYGQTGSGKTYTMMGELREVENCPSEDRGMTPRIFEYLFARIKEEEEKRKEEKLKYNCRCSFLEIYNEHITDLLEPSSSNLQLREDTEKGVYVEGLKECEASSVRDIMTLLLQGVSNRRMEATKMNSESSRSHSVFTCVIESRWEKDSLAHLRFSRLNLVDLAGSERQKSSGAEGERLKEAANINRSLSTLGLVIMSLVDIANGKNRHVPYRDSRLTFLLQDSLGGNSKTTILATVSPSVCSSSETLSTLKFAQRAKLIQNNAKVNEDSSGDVMALQRQIQILKDQLRSLTMNHDISTNLANPLSSFHLDNSLLTFGESKGDTLNDATPLNQEENISNSETDKQFLHNEMEKKDHKSAETIQLEEQINFLTQENKKLQETIASRDSEWETAIFDLTRFLSDGCDSLQDATESIENVMCMFPKRVGSLERAIRDSLEREKSVHDLRERLDDAKRIEREMEVKLDCLRGATLAITELHEKESDERFVEIFDMNESLHEGSVHESTTKVCFEEVTENLEKRTKHTTDLFYQFEKAQETMKEAELILSSLLNSTETAREERNSLIKSQFSSLEETSHLVSSIEESFCAIKCEMSDEIEGIQSDTASFVHEVKQWIEKLRSFFVNLPREIERKNEVVQGLFFDLRLLQESTAHESDIKEKYKQIELSLKNLQDELNAKTSLLAKMSERQEFVEMELSISKSELERMQELCSVYENQNSELETLLKEQETKNEQIQASLEEKCELIEGLEREILSKNGNTGSGSKCVLSVRQLERETERIGEERDRFEKEVISLQTKLEMAMALAEEREAISVEAQQAAETSRMYAEEREKEVKVLEHSIQELEATIDVLEGKVRDLKEEAESYQLKGNHLESQVKSLTDKITFLQNGETDDLPRNMELYEAERYIEDLEAEVQYKTEEIKQYKDHISELVLHSEAQSSIFTEKYKAIEEMASKGKVSEISPASNSESNSEITEKPLRTRGSGSPFKCMSSLVHQINTEKEKELSKARQRIQELESLLSSKQQEICMLTARLAAVDTMTHDVIRDLLGVKLDITNYANMLDQEQLENLLLKSHQQAEESKAKDEEILSLRKTIDQLIDERESLIEDINQRKSDILTSQMAIEELEQKEKLLFTKNKILKMEKVNLQKKIVEMDGIIESMANNTSKEGSSSRKEGNEEFKKRLEKSDKLLSHARHELYMSRHSKP